MRHADTFWERRKLRLEKSWRLLRRGSPEAVSELRTAFALIAAAADAGGDRRLAKRAQKLARRFRSSEKIEKHRKLLSRLQALGLLSPESAASLDVRWEERARKRLDRGMRATQGRPIRRFRRALARRGRRARKDLGRSLQKALRRNGRRLEPPSPESSDRAMRRLGRVLARRAALAQALSETGGAQAHEPLGGPRIARNALERWSEIRAFGRRIHRERRDAESRGAVTLASELDRLISAVDASLVRARREAVKSVRAASNVVAFERRRSA